MPARDPEDIGALRAASDVLGIDALLSDDELVACFGHELAHHRLWTADGGRILVADRLLGSGAGHVMGIVSIVSLMASNSAMTFAGPRVYFAMARDGVFLDAASKVHPSYKTPAFSLIAQTIWVSLLILTGSGNALLAYTGFSITLFLGIAVFALFVLRRREPNAPRPFNALGYPIAPAIFCAACFLT